MSSRWFRDTIFGVLRVCPWPRAGSGWLVVASRLANVLGRSPLNILHPDKRALIRASYG
ncbi:MAG: hypothetical protein HGA45_18265 [Chloroflexales bacterium]|nr:hypothetical protein [Chloroflexales bacterium]